MMLRGLSTTRNAEYAAAVRQQSWLPPRRYVRDVSNEDPLSGMWRSCWRKGSARHCRALGLI
jgi:hypothetical protein